MIAPLFEGPIAVVGDVHGGIEPFEALRDSVAPCTCTGVHDVPSPAGRCLDVAVMLQSGLDALRRHWPEYLIEAWALGLFMVSASLATILFEYPASPWHVAIANAGLRRLCTGLLMGLTAVALIYSPWGRRSGAHMNPAVTLAYLSLGRVARWDALYYCLFQVAGGLLGVVLVWCVCGASYADPPVQFIVTVPGRSGAGVAFAAETAMAFLLMYAVLALSARPPLAHCAGLAAGLLVAMFVTVEAPLSGMSINPARSLASALPAGRWTAFWVYLTAPVIGMWLAARPQARTAAGGCAKLYHDPQRSCIHCGQP